MFFGRGNKNKPDTAETVVENSNESAATPGPPSENPPNPSDTPLVINDNKKRYEPPTKKPGAVMEKLGTISEWLEAISIKIEEVTGFAFWTIEPEKTNAFYQGDVTLEGLNAEETQEARTELQKLYNRHHLVRKRRLLAEMNGLKDRVEGRKNRMTQWSTNTINDLKNIYNERVSNQFDALSDYLRHRNWHPSLIDIEPYFDRMCMELECTENVDHRILSLFEQERLQNCEGELGEIKRKIAFVQDQNAQMQRNLQIAEWQIQMYQRQYYPSAGYPPAGYPPTGSEKPGTYIPQPFELPGPEPTTNGGVEVDTNRPIILPTTNRPIILPTVNVPDSSPLNNNFENSEILIDQQLAYIAAALRKLFAVSFEVGFKPLKPGNIFAIPPLWCYRILIWYVTVLVLANLINVLIYLIPMLTSLVKSSLSQMNSVSKSTFKNIKNNLNLKPDNKRRKSSRKPRKPRRSRKRKVKNSQSRLWAIGEQVYELIVTIRGGFLNYPNGLRDINDMNYIDKEIFLTSYSEELYLLKIEKCRLALAEEVNFVYNKIFKINKNKTINPYKNNQVKSIILGIIIFLGAFEGTSARVTVNQAANRLDFTPAIEKLLTDSKIEMPEIKSESKLKVSKPDQKERIVKMKRKRRKAKLVKLSDLPDLPSNSFDDTEVRTLSEKTIRLRVKN